MTSSMFVQINWCGNINFRVRAWSIEVIYHIDVITSQMIDHQIGITILNVDDLIFNVYLLHLDILCSNNILDQVFPFLIILFLKKPILLGENGR